MHDSIAVLRFASALGTAIWFFVSMLTLPTLIKANPRNHPLIVLLIGFVIINLYRSIILFMHTVLAAEALKTIEQSFSSVRWGFVSISLRAATIIEAILFTSMIWKATRDD